MGTLNLIRKMNFDKMFATAEKVAQEADKAKITVLADMVWCGLRYGAGYSDYALFHMWNMNADQRGSVLTRGKNNRYVHALNDPAQMHYFAQKTEFLEKFAPYVKRRWLDLRQADAGELEEMMKTLGVVLVKPEDATHGDGVEKFYAADTADFGGLYAQLKAEGRTLVEEVIEQHSELNRLWPGSINTVRLVTIYANGKGNIVESLLRVGNSDKPVDNFNSGGMVVPLDIANGRVLCAAMSKKGERFEAHPATGTQFEGFTVPMWEQVTALVEEAAGVVEGVRYVGWDVAVTPEGPVLVEGNQYPGHDIYGLPGQSAEQMGVLPNFEKVLPMKDLPKR